MNLEEEKTVFTMDELLCSLKEIGEDDIVIDDTELGKKVTVLPGVFKDDLLKIVETIINYESQDEHENVFLDLKQLDTEKLADVFRYALKQENLNDPLLILNIINLIKVYNSLDDAFFQSPDIYFDSIEELLDLKLEISSELAEFTKKVSLYFISLFKSYNKFHYTMNDKHYKLPNIYKSIFLSTDLLTLSGIFADSENFDTSECILVEDAILYLTSLLMKGSMSFELIEMFLKDNVEKE